MQWKILDTGKRSAQENMNIDEQLLNDMRSSDPPLLHLYDWQGPSITYGHFIDPEKFFNIQALTALDIALAKRPTGGGITFHLTDWAFSALVPFESGQYNQKSLDNYLFINHFVKKIVNFFLPAQHLSFLPHEGEMSPEKPSDFCMTKPTRYDVMIGQWKIAGGAQRRNKHGYLHQGSITITCPKKEIVEAVLLKGDLIYNKMLDHTFSLLKDTWKETDLEEMRSCLKRQLQKELRS